MQLDKPAEICLSIGCQIQKNAPMSENTSFHIGGPADLLVTVPDAAKMRMVKSIFEKEEIPVFILGNGTNLLVSDKGIDGVVIKTDGQFAQPEFRDELVFCQAGVPLKKLCKFVRDNGLSGLEFAYGIPGTVGGAIYMNAGAYNGQISNVLQWVEAFFADSEITRVEKDKLNLGYRHSIFMEEESVVTGAAFLLKPDDPEKINLRMEDFMRRRREKQPLEYPSAGSFFKRPKNFFAGALIESSGLKGRTVGGAQVSEKHAGFIINRGGATCSDVRRLADTVMECVMRDHKIMLQPEVCFIGRE
ncbi:MAG: UDP-N-acetylmuramate dehydrogenase [Oscillospiraceae bacterium]|nr:UDP-N-acetylmuramate dehydrogenase [Oscillospiraceae bacterium]